MRIEFTKMTGAGNDFVVIDNRSGLVKNASELAQKLCDRRWGIGADGLLLLENSSVADYRMMYYNADGSYGGMCGNGGRCIASYALLHRIASAEQRFEALDFVYAATVLGSRVSLSMKNPTGLRSNLMLRVTTQKAKAHFVDTGSPHVVIPLRKGVLDKLDVVTIGSRIAHSRKFGSMGTNVNFVEVDDHKMLHMRTYERGVEAETLACGTGSIACALVGNRLWKLESPVTIMARSGKRLEVTFRSDGSSYEGIVLSGPAEVVFTGSVEV